MSVVRRSAPGAPGAGMGGIEEISAEIAETLDRP